MARTKRPPRNRVARIVDFEQWRLIDNLLTPCEELASSVPGTIRNNLNDTMITFKFPGGASLTINRSLLIAAGGPLKALVSVPFRESLSNIVTLDEPYSSFCAIRDFLYEYPIDMSLLSNDFYLIADKWQLDTLVNAFFTFKLDEACNLDDFCWYAYGAMRLVSVPTIVRHYTALRFTLLFELEELDISHCIRSIGFQDLKQMLDTTNTATMVQQYVGRLCSKEKLSLALCGEDLRGLNLPDAEHKSCFFRKTVWCKGIAGLDLYQREQSFTLESNGIKEIRISQACVINDNVYRNESSLNLTITSIVDDKIDVIRDAWFKKRISFKIATLEDGCCCELLETASINFEKLDVDVEQTAWYRIGDLIGGVRHVVKKGMVRWMSRHHPRCGLVVVIDMVVDDA